MNPADRYVATVTVNGKPMTYESREEADRQAAVWVAQSLERVRADGMDRYDVELRGAVVIVGRFPNGRPDLIVKAPGRPARMLSSSELRPWIVGEGSWTQLVELPC